MERIIQVYESENGDGYYVLNHEGTDRRKCSVTVESLLDREKRDTLGKRLIREFECLHDFMETNKIPFAKETECKESEAFREYLGTRTDVYLLAPGRYGGQ